VSDNSTEQTGGGMSVGLGSDAATADIINNIVWGNTALNTLNAPCAAGDIVIDGPGQVVLMNNDFDQATGICVTDPAFEIDPSNVVAEPGFLNAAGGDYHLDVTSPLINQGAEHPSKPELDIDGQERVMGAAVDMGADEVGHPAPPIVSAATPTKDTTPTWTWASGGGGNNTFRYRLDNPVLTTGATTTTGKSFTPATALANGNHTLYVQERNAAGIWSATGSKTVLIDTVLPINGTVTATPGAGQIALKWSGFSDASSGIAGYKVVYATGAAPASCSVGTVVSGYDGVSTSYTHKGLIKQLYYYRVCAKDKAGNVSTGVTRSAKPL